MYFDFHHEIKQYIYKNRNIKDILAVLVQMNILFKKIQYLCIDDIGVVHLTLYGPFNPVWSERRLYNVFKVSMIVIV